MENDDMRIATPKEVNMLWHFFDDGMNECSWLPDNFGDLLYHCQSQNVMMTDQCIVIFMDNKKFTYIDTIYVKKEYRGRGIATKVMKIFTDQARSCVICNKKLIDFYESLGFKQDKDLPYAIMIREKD